MPKLHLINSHLGGMGKSLFSRVMIHLHQITGVPFLAFDADYQTSNVYCYYPQVTQRVRFSESNFSSTDGILEAIESGVSVIVNLPSNASDSVASWLSRDRVVESLQVFARRSLLPHEIVNWFLSDGSRVSLEEFRNCIESYGCPMTQVLVRNMGRSQADAWERSESDPVLASALHQAKVYQIELPRFYQPSSFDDLHQPFAEVLEREELNLLDLQRVETFLEECQAALDQSGLVLFDPVLQETVQLSLEILF